MRSPPLATTTLEDDAGPGETVRDASAALRRYLRFLGAERHALDDLVQETLLAACRTFGATNAPLPWLLVTARNALRLHLRREGRRREVADLDRLDAAYREQVQGDGGEAQLQALRRCLQELPERSRRALELRYGDGASRASIAAAVGLGEEGAKALLARVRAALGACIERRLRDA